MTRRSLAVAVFLAAAIGCSDTSGPGLDGPQFVSLTVDGTAWRMVSYAVLRNPDAKLVSINGFFNPPGSGRSYSLQINLNPFKGAGTYPLGVGTSDQFAILVAMPTAYGIQADTPGSLELTAIRASDSMMVGRFHAQLHKVDDPSSVRDVSGEFRLLLTP